MNDLGELRSTMGCFITGVTIVTTCDPEGVPRGFTANSFTSGSLDPPLVLVCISKKASSLAAFSSTRHFVVNVLSEDQKRLSATFASRTEDKFAGLTWTAGLGGAPIIAGTCAWLDCSVHQRTDGGDHVILIGRVEGFGRSGAAPLGYYSGSYFTFGQEREVAEAATVGGIFERGGEILLVRRASHFSLPVGRTLGERKIEPGSLFDLLGRAGIRVAVDFVFSIAHEDGDHRAGIYYRGRILDWLAENNSSVVLVPVDAIPWASIRSQNQRAMLARYVGERTHARFGIYVGPANGSPTWALEPSVS
jgi:flavin-dependent trigonelline monooxygenase, reductase component